MSNVPIAPSRTLTGRPPVVDMFLGEDVKGEPDERPRSPDLHGFLYTITADCAINSISVSKQGSVESERSAAPPRIS